MCLVLDLVRQLRRRGTVFFPGRCRSFPELFRMVFVSAQPIEAKRMILDIRLASIEFDVCIMELGATGIPLHTWERRVSG